MSSNNVATHLVVGYVISALVLLASFFWTEEGLQFFGLLILATVCAVHAILRAGNKDKTKS